MFDFILPFNRFIIPFFGAVIVALTLVFMKETLPKIIIIIVTALLLIFFEETDVRWSRTQIQIYDIRKSCVERGIATWTPVITDHLEFKFMK
jgi:hypothetical protein